MERSAKNKYLQIKKKYKQNNGKAYEMMHLHTNVQSKMLTVIIETISTHFQQPAKQPPTILSNNSHPDIPNRQTSQKRLEKRLKYREITKCQSKIKR